MHPESQSSGKINSPRRKYELRNLVIFGCSVALSVAIPWSLVPQKWSFSTRLACAAAPLFLVIHLMMHVNWKRLCKLQSILQSIVLLIIWSGSLSVLFSPFLIVSHFLMAHASVASRDLYTALSVILVSHIPLLICICLQDQQNTNKSRHYLKFLYFTWDVPLMLWLIICKWIGLRALDPFFSSVDSQIAVGSMPLPGDSEVLRFHRVGLVVNMCLEYPGPIPEYQGCQIEQLHLPTPDICVPTLDAIVEGVNHMRIYLSKHRHGRVFVHCKGGRSRSVIVTLCFLVAQEATSQHAVLIDGNGSGSVVTRSDLNDIARQAMKKIRVARDVAESALKFAVVNEFLDYLSASGGDFDRFVVEYHYRKAALRSLGFQGLESRTFLTQR